MKHSLVITQAVKTAVKSEQVKQQFLTSSLKPVMSIQDGFLKAKKEYAQSFEILKDK